MFIFFNPHHRIGNCPSYGQSSNFAYEQMNNFFSNPGFESNSNIYTPHWNNHSDFLWQAHTMKNYAPQFHELQHSEYLQFDNLSSIPSSYDYLSQQSSLEDSLKKLMQLTG
jgi:hypothetical protein